EGPRVEFNDENLEAFAAGELHGGDHVGVAGKENDAVHDLFEGEGGDIDAVPHVHALLFEVGVHVPGTGRARRGAGHKGLAVGAAEVPAAGFEFAAAQGHETCLAEVKKTSFEPNRLASPCLHQETLWLVNPHCSALASPRPRPFTPQFPKPLSICPKPRVMGHPSISSTWRQHRSASSSNSSGLVPVMPGHCSRPDPHTPHSL